MGQLGKILLKSIRASLTSGWQDGQVTWKPVQRSFLALNGFFSREDCLSRRSMVPSIASTSMGPPAVASDRLSRRSSSKEIPAEKERHRSPKRSSSRDRKEKRRHTKNGTGSEEDAAGGARVRDDWKGKKVSGPKESAFQYMYPIVDIPIPPALIQDAHRAADELMDTLLMRCVGMQGQSWLRTTLTDVIVPQIRATAQWCTH